MALNNADKTPSGQWHSAESLSTSSSDDTRLLGMLSSTTKERPPLPPQHSPSLDSKTIRNERPAEAVVSQIPHEAKPQPAARSQSQSTQKVLDQDGTNQTPPQPHPRRRLASFGGMSSPGSLSPFTGLSAYNRNNNGNKPTGSAESESHCGLSTSLDNRGSTGCLKLSPENSGRSTPVASPGPMHLQHIRDQMVVALQKLKEMEEQVKIIPILQVKISVLQEEKRQLASQLKHQNEDEDMTDIVSKGVDNSERSVTGKNVTVCTENDLKKIKELNEEMEDRKENEEVENFQTCHKNGHVKKGDAGIDRHIDRTLPTPLRKNISACGDRLELKSAGTEGSKDNLGINTKQKAELEAQQVIISALRERIHHLEAELKESTLQTEMSRLKMELQAAGARNSLQTARTFTDSNTISQGVGNHTEYRDASTVHVVEVRTTGTCCSMPENKDVCLGPDIAMSNWVVRERVEVVEKGVGNHILTNTQGVGTKIKVCDAETNTEAPLENLDGEKSKKKYNSVACGDCSVDVFIYEAKDMVSLGISTNQVSGVNQGTMVSPLTASQHTNTSSSTVSRFTNTRHAFNSDSSTNTIQSSRDKHTNTTHALTRTASVGTKFREMRCTPDTCTSLLASVLKQTPGTVTKVTKDTGVGFTNVNDNFLVGLKTRNMASGPSHLPDPMKTRSVGVGEGRIQDLTVLSSNSSQKTQQPPQSQWQPELNHYIEKMHRLLKEHGDLLTENCAHLGDRCKEQEGVSPIPSNTSKVAVQGGPESRPPGVQSSGGGICNLHFDLKGLVLLPSLQRDKHFQC